MADMAADILVETLHDWGVEVVFGLPGDGINAMMEVFRRRRPGIHGRGPGALRRGARPGAGDAGARAGRREKIALTVLGDRVRELV